MKNPAVVLERCDTFVGRTMNWLYDHIRLLPDYTPVVLCDRLENRDEFPEVEAWTLEGHSFLERVWRRFGPGAPYPPLRRRLDRMRPHLLHSHFGWVAVNDLDLSRALALPWVIGFYGADVYLHGRSPEWRDRYVPVFEESTVVLALGPTMAAALVRLGCPEEKVEIHALGVEAASLPNSPREPAPDEDLRVLFAGTFREKKGIQYLLHAVHLARSSGVRLRLDLVGDKAGREGDAETKAEIFRLINDLGLENLVVHHSWLRFSDLLDLATRCHLFIAPSVTASDGDAEGTPFVIQQMMATGMPVIATRHSDIPFLFGGRSELLVPERDARAIANRIEAYAEDPERLAVDGQALRNEILSRFELHERAAALARLYHRIESGEPRSRSST